MVLMEKQKLLAYAYVMLTITFINVAAVDITLNSAEFHAR